MATLLCPNSQNQGHFYCVRGHVKNESLLVIARIFMTFSFSINQILDQTLGKMADVMKIQPMESKFKNLMFLILKGF